MAPRIYELPSGPIQIGAVGITLNWEGEPDVTERLIYVGGATEPSVILRPKALTRKDKAVYWWLRLTCYMTGLGTPLNWRWEWNEYLLNGRRFWRTE